MDFEEFLSSKKIDSKAFEAAEKVLFGNWQREFEQMHPNSFTVQKLNLINPIRRKYPLATASRKEPATAPKSMAPQPVMKPKPKIK